MALPPTVPVRMPPLSPPQPSLHLPATAGAGALSSRPRPAVGPAWSPPPPSPASFLSSPACSTDSVLIDFAHEAPAAALRTCQVGERQVEEAEEEEEEEEEITAVVRRSPASVPPAAAMAAPDAWKCELWEDDAFARIDGRSAAAPTGRTRQSAVASSASVTAALLTPSPSEAVLADAHRQVASQLGALETIRSTWVSLMFMAAGQAAP
ncbi:hypothetical protein MMPV_005293 [Pyropia vietnamensis]